MITYTYFSQAIVDIKTQEPVRVELLLRMWDAEKRIWRLPDDFEITVTMQMRLMKRALQQMTIKNVNINLTPTQFGDEVVMHKLIDFKQNSDELGALTVELTDTPSLEQLQTIGAKYRAAGVQLAIDDVGTDNDDFELVERLAPYVDNLKFALQNLRATGSDANWIDEIKLWQDLAIRNNIQFTFEGLETFADLQLAHNLGIDQAQGFYFSRPAMPVTGK